jgi:zinc D-Ala-D-Ala carboxypeptidase
MSQAQWDKYKNFSKREFDCKHTAQNEMTHEFMEKLQALRDAYGKPMVITSGYRSPRHPVEARKKTPGTHSQGIACDVGVMGEDALRLVAEALKLGFTGIGVSQKAGGARFIHLDISKDRSAIWSY